MKIEIKNKQIVKLEDNFIKKIGDGYLGDTESIEYLYMSMLESVGFDFLYHNKSLETLDVPKFRSTRSYFLYRHPKKKIFLKEINENKYKN